MSRVKRSVFESHQHQFLPSLLLFLVSTVSTVDPVARTGPARPNTHGISTASWQDWIINDQRVNTPSVVFLVIFSAY